MGATALILLSEDHLFYHDLLITVDVNEFPARLSL